MSADLLDCWNVRELQNCFLFLIIYRQEYFKADCTPSEYALCMAHRCTCVSVLVVVSSLVALGAQVPPAECSKFGYPGGMSNALTANRFRRSNVRVITNSCDRPCEMQPVWLAETLACLPFRRGIVEMLDQ